MQSWTTIGIRQLMYARDQSESPLYGLPEGSGVHLTGFTDPMPSLASASVAALAKLGGKSFLTWGGDHYNAQSFTSLIPKYLEVEPTAKVLAFRNFGNHGEFKQTWNSFADQYRGRFYIVEVHDAQDEARHSGVLWETHAGGLASGLGGAVKYFLLGRLAVKILGTRRVVAMGGGGIVGCEMKCGVNYDSAHWTVFALSRGRREAKNTLMDEAAQNPQVELICNLGPNEAQAFSRGMPPTLFPPPAWVRMAQLAQMPVHQQPYPPALSAEDPARIPMEVDPPQGLSQQSANQQSANQPPPPAQLGSYKQPPGKQLAQPPVRQQPYPPPLSAEDLARLALERYGDKDGDRLERLTRRLRQPLRLEDRLRHTARQGPGPPHTRRGPQERP